MYTLEQPQPKAFKMEGNVPRGPNPAATLRPGKMCRAGQFHSFNALSLALAGVVLTISATTPSPEPLFQAIRTGNIAEIKRALDRGISASAVDRSGTPALMLATLFGDAAVVKLLLDRSADPNATNEAGATALMWAMRTARACSLRGANETQDPPTSGAHRCWLQRDIPTRRIFCEFW